VAGRFVVVRDGDDGYRFRIEAEDGQLMATSEPYTSKSSALKGVEAIKRNAADAQVDDQWAMTRPPRPRPASPPRRLAVVAKQGVGSDSVASAAAGRPEETIAAYGPAGGWVAPDWLGYGEAGSTVSTVLGPIGSRGYGELDRPPSCVRMGCPWPRQLVRERRCRSEAFPS